MLTGAEDPTPAASRNVLKKSEQNSSNFGSERMSSLKQ